MQVSMSQVANPPVSELNECDVVNEVESEECDNPEDLAYLSSSDDTNTNEFNNTVNEEATTPTQVDNPCHSSHIAISAKCVIMQQLDTHKHHFLHLIIFDNSSASGGCTPRSLHLRSTPSGNPL